MFTVLGFIPIVLLFFFFLLSLEEKGKGEDICCLGQFKEYCTDYLAFEMEKGKAY